MCVLQTTNTHTPDDVFEFNILCWIQLYTLFLFFILALSRFLSASINNRVEQVNFDFLLFLLLLQTLHTNNAHIGDDDARALLNNVMPKDDFDLKQLSLAILTFSFSFLFLP